MQKICRVLRLGQVAYQPAWELQDRLAAQIAAGSRPETLLLLEHPHTFTFGRRGQAENLLWSPAELQEREVQVFWVDRGGDITYHGPGQLVGYPLLRLGALLPQAGEGSTRRLPQADYVGYLRRLEAALIQALDELGVEAGPRAGLTGVWNNRGSGKNEGTGWRKLASIGVKVDARGITRHGFALNVNPRMDYWQGIVACGLPGEQQTSLAELLPAPDMPAVMAAVERAFGRVFDYHLVEEGEP